VRRLGDLTAIDLLQRVDALAGRVEGVHEMHFGVVLRGPGLVSRIGWGGGRWGGAAAGDGGGNALVGLVMEDGSAM
jgi:hypothetical protein